MIEFLTDNYTSIIEGIAYIVVGANAITMVTPTEADDKVTNGLLKVLNVCAGNVMKNINKDVLED